MKLFLALALTLCSNALSAPTPPEWGSFPNRPLELRDMVPPDGRRFSLIKDFNYVDPTGRLWAAPADLITDGASIPMPFWSVISGPFEGLYREAAIVHDAGCCSKMQTWQDVDHMFYNAMRCSGVGWLKAKTMFYAVWAGGPRWKTLNSTMPKECKIAQPAGPGLVIRLWQKSLAPNATTKLVQEIGGRDLTLPEARAVARPFFTRGPMTDDDATNFVAELKKREVKPEEQELIALSVIQSESFSDDDVKGVEQWVEKENPSLETIEARAETARKTGGEKSMHELRLFPQVPEVRQSLELFSSE